MLLFIFIFRGFDLHLLLQTFHTLTWTALWNIWNKKKKEGAWWEIPALPHWHESVCGWHGSQDDYRPKCLSDMLPGIGRLCMVGRFLKRGAWHELCFRSLKCQIVFPSLLLWMLHIQHQRCLTSLFEQNDYLAAGLDCKRTLFGLFLVASVHVAKSLLHIEFTESSIQRTSASVDLSTLPHLTQNPMASN